MNYVIMMSLEFLSGLFKLVNTLIFNFFFFDVNNIERQKDIFIGLLHASKSVIKRNDTLALSI